MMARILERMGEDPLTLVGRQLRVTCAPSFEGVMCVRVHEADEELHLTAILGDEDGDIPQVTTRKSLDQGAWNDLWQSVRASGLAEMSVTAPQMGTDGEFWLIEVTHEEKWHAVHRWSPDIPGPEAEFLRFGVGVLTRGGFGERVEGWLTEES